MGKIIRNIIAPAFLLLMISCERKPFEVVYFDFSGSRGVYVVNEGNFMYGNSSLSFYDAQQKQMYHDIFFVRNAAPLGDVAFTMQLSGGSAWIVVNNSGKIYRVDPVGCAFEDVLTGFLSPRYILFLPDGTAYVSDLYSPRIARIDPATGAWVDTVELKGRNLNGDRHTVEQMVRSGAHVYANCWTHDRLLLKIDTRENRVMDSLTVPLQPESMVTDHRGLLWVLTDGGYSGSPAGEEQAALLAVDTDRFQIHKMFRFPLGEHPRELAVSPSGKRLYFLNRHLWSLSVDALALPQEPMVFYPGDEEYPGYYALGVDPETGDIYLSDPMDYSRNGIIYRYSKDTLLLDTQAAGINPGYFCFSGGPL